MLVQPLAIGPLVDDLLLDLLVFDDTAFFGVHEEHPARLQATLAQDLLGRNLQHAGF